MFYQWMIAAHNTKRKVTEFYGFRNSMIIKLDVTLKIEEVILTNQDDLSFSHFQHSLERQGYITFEAESVTP